jgi:hypothetical protein
VFEEVNFHEYPRAPNLRARNLAGARLFLKRHRVNLQERSGLLQSEGAHAVTHGFMRRRVFVFV